MDAAETLSETSLRCALGVHAPQSAVHWNQGYYFTRCRRCGTDLIRTAYSRWQVPRGARVIWSHEKPAAALTGDVQLAPMDYAGADYSGLGAGSSAGKGEDELPIEALLRHLKDEPGTADETPDRPDPDAGDGLIDPDNVLDTGAGDGIGAHDNALVSHPSEPEEEPADAATLTLDPPEADIADAAMPPATEGEAAPGEADGQTEARAVEDERVAGDEEDGDRESDEAQSDAIAGEAETDEADGGEDVERPVEAAEPEAQGLVSNFPDFMDDHGAPRPSSAAPAAQAASNTPLPGMTRTWAPVEIDDNRRERLREISERIRLTARKSRAITAGATASMAGYASQLRQRPERGWTQTLLVAALLISLAALLYLIVDRQSLLAPDEAQPPAATARILPRPQPAFVAARLLNCRDAPSLQAGTVRRLQRGDAVAIQAVDQGWASISHQRGQCWSMLRYLSLEPPLGTS